jgi:alanine racemase
MTSRALARIDLSAVQRNCELLKHRLGAAELCAVVKADGYGHGAAWCARAAVAGGASWLAVATAEEAADLRRHGLRQPILVMGALTAEEVEIAIGAQADLVAWHAGFAELAARKAQEVDARARLHVKLDTGMGRLGTSDEAEALDIVERAERDERLELSGLMTHLATADEPDSPFFEQQLARFRPLAENVKSRHPSCVVHAANSAAVLRSADAHFDMARCGVAIYGLDPFQEDAAARGLGPALALESYVADVKPVPAGSSVGYGRSWIAAVDTHVAVIPIGYGDGYRRGLSNRADVIVRGRRHPVVGTISMDNITVDVGNEGSVRRGDVATLVGADGDASVAVEELARTLGTINYEITCGLTPRVRRLYHQQGQADQQGDEAPQREVAGPQRSAGT